jgi:hypothetical protein
MHVVSVNYKKLVQRYVLLTNSGETVIHGSTVHSHLMFSKPIGSLIRAVYNGSFIFKILCAA